ncbi:MAG: hypothetical protein KIT27_08025 [Legionellales bacterium]|nr:hypothetical protein [Legionellales bacterium]
MKKYVRINFIIILLSLMTGCQTLDQVDQRIQDYNAKGQAELLDRYGLPENAQSYSANYNAQKAAAEAKSHEKNGRAD